LEENGFGEEGSGYTDEKFEEVKLEKKSELESTMTTFDDRIWILNIFFTFTLLNAVWL